MIGASLTGALAAAGPFTRQLARATRGLADAPAPSAPAAPDVRDALRDAGAAVRDAVIAASETGEAEGFVATVDGLNEVLDTLASEDVSLDFQVSIANAVREAVAGVPDAAASGLTVAQVDGKERLVTNTAALAEALAKDPDALRALVTGEARIAEAINVAITEEAEEAEEVAADEAPLEPVAEVDREVASMVRSADMSVQLRTLQMLDALTLAPRWRLDILV